MRLGNGIGYFANKFMVPVTSGDALAACHDLCSANCSCLGFFYKNSSKSCFLLQNHIGSVFRGITDVAVGFIKTLPPTPSHGHGGRSSLNFITILCGIVLPTVAAVFITFLLYVQWLRRRRQELTNKKGVQKHDSSEGRHCSWFKLPMLSSQASSNAPSAGEDAESDQDEVLIPGLPARFTYDDLDKVTNGFKSQIGPSDNGVPYHSP